MFKMRLLIRMNQRNAAGLASSPSQNLWENPTWLWRSSLAAAAAAADTLAVSPILLLSREPTSKYSGSRSSRASPRLLCDRSSLAAAIGLDVYCKLSALLAEPAG